MASRIAPQSHEAVEIEKRRAFRAQDISIALALQCGRCIDCGCPIPPFEADHDKACGMGGLTTLGNLKLRCPDPCHKAKTRKDKRLIAQAKRREAKHNGTYRKTRRPMRSRGFSKAKRLSPSASNGTRNDPQAQWEGGETMSAWWDTDHKICLLTPNEFAELPDGEELTCIDDRIVVKGRDKIDGDTRFGHLAYGVTGEHPIRLALLQKTHHDQA